MELNKKNLHGKFHQLFHEGLIGLEKCNILIEMERLSDELNDLQQTMNSKRDYLKYLYAELQK